MVDVVSQRRRCGHPGCNKHPLFGVVGSKTAEFCSPHAKEGMMNVVHQRCDHPDCGKRPLYGVDGSKTAEFCSPHAKEGMVNVVSKRCGHPSCNKRPSFGVAGSKTAEFCSPHAKEGMVNVVHGGNRYGHPVAGRGRRTAWRAARSRSSARWTREGGQGEHDVGKGYRFRRSEWRYG